MQILKAFESLYNQREALRKDIKELIALIKELEAKPKDSSYEKRINDLKSERNALVRVAQDIKKKEVFNFLSDEGLLLNYAFPEAGIILKAVLYRNKNDESDLPEGEKGKRKFDKIVYEYNRSASSAISEFAPLNDFYVDGRKITIDQVDLGTSKIEPWRLCPNCSHAEPEISTKVITVCPKCQCTGWASEESWTDGIDKLKRIINKLLRDTDVSVILKNYSEVILGSMEVIDTMFKK